MCYNDYCFLSVIYSISPLAAPAGYKVRSEVNMFLLQVHISCHSAVLQRYSLLLQLSVHLSKPNYSKGLLNLMLRLAIIILDKLWIFSRCKQVCTSCLNVLSCFASYFIVFHGLVSRVVYWCCGHFLMVLRTDLPPSAYTHSAFFFLCSWWALREGNRTVRQHCSSVFNWRICINLSRISSRINSLLFREEKLLCFVEEIQYTFVLFHH